jgi:nitrate reductase assembly molybdenum cofactor insertion protein NarJ
MGTGVWDGIDKPRVAKALVTAYGSDEYLEVLAAVNNAETLGELAAARERIKELMALWRQECPEYAFVIDVLFLFSERMEQQIATAGD